MINLRVRPLSAEWTKDQYSLTFACVGFESRARYALETGSTTSALKVATTYPDRRVHSFKSNLCWFTNNGYNVVDVNDDSYRTEFCRAVRSSDSSTGHRSILVDITSLTRHRLAEVVGGCIELTREFNITATFVYSLAAYAPPPPSPRSNKFVGPINADYAGWSIYPDKPSIAVVGVGYEENKALGAVEYLQPVDVWLYVPVSAVDKYTPVVQSANRVLFDSVPQERRMAYDLSDPSYLYAGLESLVYGLSRKYNIILLPLGPKLFALCSLLVATMHPATCSVWRVSAGHFETAVDRASSGVVYGLCVDFTRSKSLAD